MHVAAIIAGALLTLNCGFFSIYLLKMNLRMRSVMNANGLPGDRFFFEHPKLLIVPFAQATGPLIGIALLWWGLST